MFSSNPRFLSSNTHENRDVRPQFVIRNDFALLGLGIFIPFETYEK